MKLPAITNNVTLALGKASLTLKKASPEICLAAGIGLGIAAAVTACVATLKVNAVVEEAKDTINTIHESSEHGANPAGIDYSEDDKNKDLAIVYSKTAVKFVKLYGPSIIMGAASIALLINGNKILRSRNVALAAAYTAVDKAYNEYRSRVIDRFGEEVDKQLKYGFEKQTIEETVKDENGNDKVVKKEVDVVSEDSIKTSPYAKFFDESSREWQKDANYNLMFLRRIQSVMNDRLRAKGYVFLNDVYDALDILRTPEGQTIGWVYDINNPKLHNYIDFGLYNINYKSTRDFVNGIERSILLDFNVDGDIMSAFKSYEVK